MLIAGVHYRAIRSQGKRTAYFQRSESLLISRTIGITWLVMEIASVAIAVRVTRIAKFLEESEVVTIKCGGVEARRNQARGTIKKSDRVKMSAASFWFAIGGDIHAALVRWRWLGYDTRRNRLRVASQRVTHFRRSCRGSVSSSSRRVVCFLWPALPGLTRFARFLVVLITKI